MRQRGHLLFTLRHGTNSIADGWLINITPPRDITKMSRRLQNDGTCGGEIRPRIEYLNKCFVFRESELKIVK